MRLLGVGLAAAMTLAAAVGTVTTRDRSAAAPLGPGDVTVLVDIEHSRFSPSRLRVAEGTRVRFVVTNADPINHELVVGPRQVHERHRGGREAAHPPVPGEVSVPPLQARTTTYAFDSPGVVLFACHLPGHEDYGMRGAVEVVRTSAR